MGIMHTHPIGKQNSSTMSPADMNTAEEGFEFNNNQPIKVWLVAPERSSIQVYNPATRAISIVGNSFEVFSPPIHRWTRPEACRTCWQRDPTGSNTKQKRN
ncbi:hypothetical protein ACE02Y_16855 [Shewanella xiamenensis]|uniref:hypothetical protein n=1 Tax=Shewanella xiamenensis TaxID=332186 RepID=UPI00313BB50D